MGVFENVKAESLGGIAGFDLPTILTTIGSGTGTTYYSSGLPTDEGSTGTTATDLGRSEVCDNLDEVLGLLKQALSSLTTAMNNCNWMAPASSDPNKYRGTYCENLRQMRLRLMQVIANLESNREKLGCNDSDVDLPKDDEPGGDDTDAGEYGGGGWTVEIG